METIEWNASFSVGVRSLDRQHKRIVDVINTLIVHPQMTVRSETISELLSKLTGYANDHFQTEEHLLEKSGYPELARQKEEHRAYCAKVVGFCQDTMNHNEQIPAELLEFTRNWWHDHILGSDMKFRPFLAEHGVT